MDRKNAKQYRWENRRVWYRYLHILSAKHETLEVWDYSPSENYLTLRDRVTLEIRDYSGPAGIERAALRLGARW